jgi:hypothetical protein
VDVLQVVSSPHQKEKLLVMVHVLVMVVEVVDNDYFGY